MAETYDVVIIGAGHNGLILANYLARAGVSVLCCEKRLEAGGGLSTEEVTIPGFYHNLHSFFHDAVEIAPFYKDLEMERFGTEYIRPPVQLGMALSGNKCLIIHEDIDITINNILKFSFQDAQEYKKLHDGYAEFIEAIVLPALFTPPFAPSHQVDMLEKTKEGREFMRLSRLSPKDAVKEAFENEALRASILFQLLIPRGVVHDYHGLGMLMPLIVTQAEKSHICVGGSHALAHALWKALLSAGGKLRGCMGVKKILVKDGKAYGVVLENGDEVHASKAVVSTAAFKQTFLHLVGKEHLPSDFVKQVQNFKLDEFSIFSVHLALKEPPRYASASFNTDMDKAFKVGVGFESVNDFDDMFVSIRRGELPKPALYAACPTLFDPKQAPDGLHTAFLWQPAPFQLNGKKWDDVKDDYARECLKKWQEAAPNMNEKNIIKYKVYTPEDIPKKIQSMCRGGVFLGRMTQDQLDYFRPFPELSQYRTPIQNLYLAGACTHPGGGILGACAYNAATVMAEDLGFNRWWEK